MASIRRGGYLHSKKWYSVCTQKIELRSLKAPRERTPRERISRLNSDFFFQTVRRNTCMEWAILFSNASGATAEFVGILMDVTERRLAEALRDGESRILEMIARDAPLEEILESLVRVVEAQFAGLLCSVLLLDDDGQHVRHGAAPSLPKAYTKAIDRLVSDRRRDLVAPPCTAENLLSSLIFSGIRSGSRTEAWPSPMDFAPAGPLPYLRIRAMRWARLPCITANRAVRARLRPRALEMATHLGGIAIERKLAREERERLRQAQADLAHINRVTTMGELTASLAHEIRQPISAAVTNAKNLLAMAWSR